MPKRRDEPAGNPVEPSDQTLLFRFRRGQGQAATAIYLRYAHRLRGLVDKQKGADLAGRLDADDIVQSVFRTFFRRAAAGHYDVPEGDELWKLFLVIGLNKLRSAATHHRAAKRDIRRTTSPSDAATVASKDDDVALTVLQMVIDDVLSRLPVGHRRFVEMRIEGHEIADISRETGRARRSIERVLQEFRDRLRREIASE
ncbi:MAG: RNA polymerase sigma factor [Gemmataceae bacterium]